jgi:hypothetical protein
MVESMIRLRSGSKPNAVKRRFQTPCFPHRRNRFEYAVPFAELFGQVTPGCAGPHQPQHSIDEQTIVLAVSAVVTWFAWNKRFDVLPPRVRQFSPNQDRPP